MKKTFIRTGEFSSGWRRLGLDDEALQHLEYRLFYDSEGYPSLADVEGLSLFCLSRREGAGPVLRFYEIAFLAREVIYLLNVRAKGEGEGMTKDERASLARMLNLFDECFKEGKNECGV